MKIIVITLFPQMVWGFLQESILKRAQRKGAVEIEVVNLRDFALNAYGTVDDRPYGGGAGMVMRVDVLAQAIVNVKTQSASRRTKIILTSAKGKTFTQAKAQDLAKLDHLIIIAGHYEGVDARVMKYVDEEISIGDFVLTGGEIPAAFIIDSIVRLLPGVLKKAEATQEISVVGKTEILSKLQKHSIKVVQLLEYPHFTRPEEFEGIKVPKELLSGDHEKIRTYRLKKAYEETVQKRPDLLDIIRE